MLFLAGSHATHFCFLRLLSPPMTMEKRDTVNVSMPHLHFWPQYCGPSVRNT